MGLCGRLLFFRGVAGAVDLTVNEVEDTGTFEARLTVPEGDLVLAIDRFNEFSPCQDGGIVAYLHEHGTDSGCGDTNWSKTFVFLAGWGFGHATLNGQPLYEDYEMHFMVTQGIRDRTTLRVNYPMLDKRSPAGEVNPATQQIDFYVRSPEQNPLNSPNREVFLHFFGMEVTWKFFVNSFRNFQAGPDRGQPHSCSAPRTPVTREAPAARTGRPRPRPLATRL